MTTIFKNFLVNRDQTGRQIICFPETGKVYHVEYIEPRGHQTNSGDVNPATKKIEGSYGEKYKGAIIPDESLITEENGFKSIIEGNGSLYEMIRITHDNWKKENGYG